MVDLTSGRLRGCKDSIGGISKVYIFPYVKYAKSQIVTTNNVITSFPATDIYQFEMDNQPIFENRADENEGGKFHNESIDLEFAEIEVYSEFHKFLNKDYRIIILDRNGKYRLLGAYNGVYCERLNRTTGESKNSFRGVRVSFNGIEKQQSLFINDLAAAGFTIIENNFLITENGEFVLTEDNQLIYIE